MQSSIAPSFFEYVVDVDPARFGHVVSVPLPGCSIPENGGDRRCYELVYGRSEPCTQCPAQRAEARKCVQREIHRNVDAYELVEAYPREDGLVHVRRARVEVEAMRALSREHMRETARRAGLSARELDVLDYLARGVEPAIIAKRLGIQPRTVKFHQTNLLRKLGLGSRADLIKLLT